MIPPDFVQKWEDRWNSHKLDHILAHYAEDVVFRSRKAIPLTGQGLVVGKSNLEAYWAEALARQPDLKFEVSEVFEGHDILVITYKNHRGIHAAETLQFNDLGLVTTASAAHAGP